MPAETVVVVVRPYFVGSGFGLVELGAVGWRCSKLSASEYSFSYYGPFISVPMFSVRVFSVGVVQVMVIWYRFYHVCFCELYRVGFGLY